MITSCNFLNVSVNDTFISIPRYSPSPYFSSCICQFPPPPFPSASPTSLFAFSLSNVVSNVTPLSSPITVLLSCHRSLSNVVSNLRTLSSPITVLISCMAPRRTSTSSGHFDLLVRHPCCTDLFFHCTLWSALGLASCG